MGRSSWSPRPASLWARARMRWWWRAEREVGWYTRTIEPCEEREDNVDESDMLNVDPMVGREVTD
jgi:hypothetical protein